MSDSFGWLEDAKADDRAHTFNQPYRLFRANAGMSIGARWCGSVAAVGAI